MNVPHMKMLRVNFEIRQNIHQSLLITMLTFKYYESSEKFDLDRITLKVHFIPISLGNFRNCSVYVAAAG